MTKKELKKEAIQYAVDYPTSYGKGYKHKDLRIAYLAGAEPREKRIAELEKACNETQELLDKQIEATYKVVEENTKLRKDLEELTITNNYQKVISDKNEQISFLETRLAEAKSLINRLSEYIVLSEDYWKKEDVERQKEILREVEKFLGVK